MRALVNRDFGTGYNLKRIGRLMEMNGWKLPRSLRRRSGRAHTGLIRREISNERWCSDVLEQSKIVQGWWHRRHLQRSPNPCRARDLSSGYLAHSAEEAGATRLGYRVAASLYSAGE
ncbi:MAG: hypothetical protein ACR2G6_06685 [Gemmatimonadaceae bacterium]